MAGASGGLHESEEKLSSVTRDLHRALVSLQEELEAVDWYQQRLEAADDPELKEILAHNRDEEKEHAAMLLEWLRRRDGHLDQVLRRYLFQQGDILALEHADQDESSTVPASPAGNGLTVGSLLPARGLP